MIRTHLPKALFAGLFLAASVHAAPSRVSANAGEARDLLYTTGSGATATVFAATQGGGVFRSTTSGATWSHLAGLSARYVYRLAVSPNSASRIYAATENGLFRSTDSGTTWTQLSFDPVTAVAANPAVAASDSLLIGVQGQGIVRVTTANTTPTFTRASTGLDSTNVTKIEFQANNTAYAVLACNYEDVSGAFPYKESNYGGLFLTTNDGASWSNENTRGGVSLMRTDGTAAKFPSKCVTDVATNATTVVATVYDGLFNQGFVQRSVSLGAWSNPTSQNPSQGDLFGVTAVRRDRNSTSTFWAGSAQVGVWKSTDSGASWAQMVNPALANDPDLYTGINVIETIAGGTAVLAAVRGYGVFTATAANPVTSGWALTTGFTADRVRGLTNHQNVAANTYYMAVEKGASFMSTNAGTSWTPLFLGLNNVHGNVTNDYIRNAQVIAAHPSSVGVVGLGVRTLGLFTLSGSTWVRQTGGGGGQNYAGATDHKPQSLVITSAGTAYYSLFDAGAATPGGLHAGGSVNAMASVTKPIFEAAPHLGVAPGAYRIVKSPVTDARLWLLMYDSEPYRTMDGSNFSRVTVAHEGFKRIAFYDLAEQPTGSGVVVGSTNKGIYRSTDGGGSFTRVTTTGLAETSLSSLVYGDGSRLFGGTLSGGFFCSKDNGTTWQAVSLGSLPPMPVREVRFLNGQVHWLTDGGGVYKSTPATDCP